jgi:hypothetical protein
MATVSEKLRGTFTSAKSQLEGFEKVAVKQVALLEKKAKASIGEVKESLDTVPNQLKGAWEQVLTRVRGALDYASRDDLNKVAHKVDDLAKKVEKLLRGENIKTVAEKKATRK